MELSDAVVVITGGNAGIGETTARAASARGARVVVVGRRAVLLDEVAASLPDAMAVVADVTKAADIERIVAATLDRYGRIDAVVNNAGQGLHVPLLSIDLDDFRAVFELNVVAPLALMQAVLPTMRAAGHGAIVNVSSGTSRMTIRGLAGYAATKAALNLMSNTAREEFAADGIVVSTVYPSLTATDFHDNLRAGHFAGGSRSARAQPAGLVAVAICELLETGEPERVLGYRSAS